MSPHTFVLILTCGAAVLALWIIARFTGFGPTSFAGAVAHVVAAMVLLKLVLPPGLDVISASGLPATSYLKLFGLALPLLVYAFLSGGWATRLAIGHLR
jgi:hypothetical protein